MQAFHDSCCTECDLSLGRIPGSAIGGNKCQLAQHLWVSNTLSRLAAGEWKIALDVGSKLFPVKWQTLEKLSLLSSHFLLQK